MSCSIQDFIGKEQDLVSQPVAEWQPVRLSPDGCNMSPAWKADDEPSRVTLKDLETVKIPFRRPIQERVAIVHERGHQGIHNTFLR